MTRLSMSDVIQAQEARIDSLTLMVERLAEQNAEMLSALATVLTEGRKPTASESVEIDRAGTGGNATIVKVNAVVQEGESLEDAGKRASAEFERRCARFPLPSGYAHPAPLGDETKPAVPPTLEQALEGSVKK